MDGADIAARLGMNVRQLREARGSTQQQMALLAGLPRATWAHLESGAANPTLSVLHRAAQALQVSPRRAHRVSPRDLPPLPEGHPPHAQPRRQVTVRKLFPDPIPGMEIDRIEVPPSGRMTGVPHTPGTREYLTCESGEVLLVVGGERFSLEPGDVAVFRGDQRHSYHNPGRKPAVGYSVVVLARVP